MDSENRAYPIRPIIAVGGLLFKGDAILLVKRAKDPGMGLWAIPGGAVNTGEKLADALIREMAEETSLTVSVGPLVEIVERVIHDQENRVLYHYVILDYLCYADLEEPPSPGSDAAEARFLHPDDWDKYNVTSSRFFAIFKKAQNLRRLGRTEPAAG